MDPWLEKSDSTVTTPLDTPNFEDNFSIETHKLPDSEEYLAVLESKLERIKNDPNVLKQLTEKREACMRALLETEHEELSNERIDLNEPVNNSAILRAVAPQLVALNQGEIAELIKHDHLEEADKQRT